MEIILKKDVANLGHADDIVNVKTGYAVNYLIPQGFASMATASAKKVHAENLRQRAHGHAANAHQMGELTRLPNSLLTLRLLQQNLPRQL